MIMLLISRKILDRTAVGYGRRIRPANLRSLSFQRLALPGVVLFNFRRVTKFPVSILEAASMTQANLSETCSNPALNILKPRR